MKINLLKMNQFYLWDNRTLSEPTLYKVENNSHTKIYSIKNNFLIGFARPSNFQISNNTTKSKFENLSIHFSNRLFNRKENWLTKSMLAKGMAGIIENYIMDWKPREKLTLSYNGNYFERNDRWRTHEKSITHETKYLIVILPDDQMYWFGKEVRKYFINSPVRLVGIASDTYTKAFGLLKLILEKNVDNLTEVDKRYNIIHYNNFDSYINVLGLQVLKNDSTLKLLKLEAFAKTSDLIGEREGDLLNEGVDFILFQNFPESQSQVIFQNINDITSTEKSNVVTVEQQNLGYQGANMLYDLLQSNSTTSELSGCNFKSIDTMLYMPVQVKLLESDDRVIYSFPVVDGSKKVAFRKAFIKPENVDLGRIVIELTNYSSKEPQIIHDVHFEIPPEGEYIIIEISVLNADLNNPELKISIKMNSGSVIKEFQLFFPRYFC